MFAVLAFGVLLAGCEKPAAHSSADPARKRLHLAFVANSPGEYWSIVNLGCSVAAQQLGNVDMDFRYPSPSTVAAQQAIVTQLLAAGVDGIAISPIDPAQQTEFLNQIAAKTLLICADSDAPDTKRAAYVGSDNVSAGRQAAELVKEALPSGGKIALFVGYAKAENTKGRSLGIRDGLKGTSVEIVETMEDGQDPAVATKNLGQALAKYPDLAGIVGLAGYHGPALLAALRDAGRVGKVKVVCFDDNTDTLAGITKGDIHGTIAQKPFQIGKQTIVQLEQMLRGAPPAGAAKQTFIETRALTKANVEHHIAQQRNIAVFLKDQAP